MGDLCNNIGLVGVYAKWSYVTASPSHRDHILLFIYKQLYYWSICSNASMYMDETRHINVFFVNYSKPHYTIYYSGDKVEKGTVLTGLA